MGSELSDQGGGTARAEAEAARTRPEGAGILILGAGPLYSGQSWALVEAEFHTRCLRLGSVEEALERGAALADLQLVIVDARLGGDLLRRPALYRAIQPGATLVFAYRDADAARQFHDRHDRMRDGVVGYLPMQAPFEVWLASLRLLLHGEVFLPGCLLGDPDPMATGAAPAAMPSAATHPAAMPPAATPCASRRLSRLTSREREVLQLVSTGTSNKVIARELEISEHTVKLHMHNLSRKLGVRNRTAAASWYMAAGQPGAGSRP